VNPLREALLRGKRRPRNAGTGSPMQYHGDGYEFVELREYVAGDDVRRIDWAATARTGALQTRIILEDVALTLAAILDTSASMESGRSRALADSAREAVDLWYGAAEAGDRVLRVFSSDVAPPAAALAEEFSITRAFEVAAAVLPRGAAVLAISDFYDLDADSDELLVLLGRRYDCTALVARDPWFHGLPLGGFIRVADAETAKTASLFIGARERANYANAVRTREAALLDRLNRANWRTSIIDETDGGTALLRAFALA
jgi:uncharacterized protein (DUF58 family)